MKKKQVFLLLFLSVNCFVHSQIDSYSKQIIEDVIIYKDVLDSSLYYYAPSKLQLVLDESGKPDFQMLKMRYIGTQCSNDEAFSHTTNLVQLRIEIPAQQKKVLDKIKSKLGKNSKLKPIRITGIESKLLVPVKGIDSVAKSKVIGQTTNASADGKEGLSTSKSYWSERMFSFNLTDKETMVLETQISDKTLALSFNYSFYAKTTNPLDDTVLKGPQGLVDKINEDIEKILLDRVIESDAFEILIDTEKWPDLVKEIDINESVPPAYAAVEVKCFDFCENLRSDLYLKIIEVSTRSVDDTKDIAIEAKFYSKQPEINTKHIHFPYAVLVGEPFKYRITELSLKGVKKLGEWQFTDTCSAIIDITTPAEQLTAEKFIMEIESDASWFIDQNATIAITISYSLNDRLESELIHLVENESLKQTSFYHDIDTPITYIYKVVTTDSILFASERKEINDIYIYISKN